MDLFAIFSLAAVNGCAGQGSARCKQYRNPKGDIAVIAGLSSPVCGDWVSSVTAAALMVNSVVAVPVSETIASVCLPTDRVSR